MSMLGATIHSVDSSGRVTLKEEQSRRLPEMVFLAQGWDGCVLLMLEQQLNDLKAVLGQYGILDPDVDDMRRMLLGTCCESKIDGQRRLKLPEALRDWAGIIPGESRALVMDLGTRYEVWEENRYRTYMDSKAPQLRNVARRLFGSVQPEEAEDEAE